MARRGRPPKYENTSATNSDTSETDPEKADRSDIIILTVELKSGRFKSQLQVPLLPDNDEEKERCLKAWGDLVSTGFRIGASEMDVALDMKSKT